MTRVWPGSTCGGTQAIAPTGLAAVTLHRLPGGGCDVDEDPDLDARSADPQWLASPDGWLQVRTAHAHSAAAPRFDLWRIPGRKRLALEGGNLALSADVGARRMRVSLSGDVADGIAYASWVPLTTSLRADLLDFKAHAQALEGQAPTSDHARPATRTALLHLRALQALDAARAGASHRDTAKALFGLEAVVLRWHEDSELRAQVRHLLRRARDCMNGGYLVLAGVRPGDETLR